MSESHALEGLFIPFFLLIHVTGLLLDKISSTRMSSRTPPNRFIQYPSDEFSLNGYKRNNYKIYGLTDFDIEYCGLDQPGAPEPQCQVG
jgi:hypothetical protein